MKAIRVRQFGGPDVMTLAEIPDPVPQPQQVLVRVHAAGVNPVETYIRTGTYARKPALPYTPGSDAGGVIEAVGRGATRLRVGQRVFVASSLDDTATGTYAEKVACHERFAHPLA